MVAAVRRTPLDGAGGGDSYAVIHIERGFVLVRLRMDARRITGIRTGGYARAAALVATEAE